MTPRVVVTGEVVLRFFILIFFLFLSAQRCVLGSDQLRVVDGVKRTGGVEPRGAVWTPKAPAPEARLAALPREARDSRMKIFSGTANRPLSQVGSPCSVPPRWLLGSVAT